MSGQVRMKVGDVVMLNSGGPRMTIVQERGSVGGARAWECFWVNNTNSGRDIFPEPALTLVASERTESK